MATRKIKDIIEDLRSAACEDNKSFKELAETTNKRADELEEILAKDKADERFYTIFLCLLVLFIGAFAFITFMSNDDLREDVTQKKEIITKFEQAVKSDTVHTYHDKDGKEITVESLLEDNLRLMKKISDLEFQISVYELELKDLEIRYGVKAVNDKNTFYMESKEVDSAMMLLPVFRDRLSYDSINNSWTISRKIVKNGEETIIE